MPFPDPGPTTPTVLGSPWKLPDKANTMQLLLTFAGLPESVTFSSAQPPDPTELREKEGREGTEVSLFRVSLPSSGHSRKQGGAEEKLQQGTG